MILSFIGLVIGLTMLIWGADQLVDGAAGVAKRWNISGHVIGVTLVATATSLPELVTAVYATITGNHGIAVGNVVGSNAFNVGIVLAVGVLLVPVKPDKLVIKDGWVVILATMVFAVFAVGGIVRLEALTLLIFYILYVFHLSRTTEFTGELDVKEKPIPLLVIMLVVGMVLLGFGGPVVVHSAVSLSKALGVSESLIALTLIALGTSLPELITTVVASLKGHEGMAVGNVLGSNLFNFLMIPGISALIHPLSVEGYMAGALIPAVLILTLLGVLLSRKKMGRKEGVLLLMGYSAFAVLLFT